MFSQQNNVIYYTVYETEIKAKTKIQITENKTLTKQDSLLSEFSNLFLKQLEQSGLSIRLIDSLFHYKDTSFIKTVADQNNTSNNEISFNVKVENSFMILFKNKFLIRKDDSLDFQPVSGEYESFIFSEKGEKILGYDTEIFINKAKTIRIWVCKDLPAGLNPKIKVLNPVGAILKYEIKNEDQTTSSIIKSLKKDKYENRGN